MHLRKVFLCCILFAGSISVFAKSSAQRVSFNPTYDEKRFHFGFVIGVNQMGYSLKPNSNMANLSDTLYGIKMRQQLGFTVGIVSNMRLGKYWDLRFVPVLSLGERYLDYNLKIGGQSIKMESKKIEATYIEFPLEIKWKAARILNSRPYITGGVRYILDLASLAKKKTENADEYVVKMKKHDIGLTLGVGWDFFLPLDSKMAIELKFFFGLNDLLVRENNYYTNYIDKINARMVQLCITFE